MIHLWAVLLPLAASDPAAIARTYENGRVARAVVEARALRERLPVDSEAAATARLVELFGLLRQKKGRESRELLALIDAHGPDLGTYGTYLRISALCATRNCAEADELIAEMPEESIFRTTALARLASCWMRSEDGNHAHATVDRMEVSAESDSRQAEAALLRARVVETTGSRREARDVYRRVLVRFPLTPAGRRAGEWLDRAGSRGMRIAPMAPEELLPRAEHERASFRAQQARRTYDAVIKEARGRRRAALRYQAELGLVELDMVDRKYQRALDRIARVDRWSRDPEIQAHALYLRGDILSRRGRVAAALASYDTVLATHPETAYAPEAALSAARLAYGARDFTRARGFLEWMLAAAPEGNDVEVINGDGARRLGAAAAGVRGHALWMSAWIERRTGGLPEVMDSFLAQIDANSPLANPALYWRARLALDGGRHLDAEVFTAVLCHRSPTSFYALAASDLLSRRLPSSTTGVELPRAVELETTPLPTVEPLDLRAAMVLSQHGLHSEAQRIVRMVPANHLSVADRAAAAWLYRKSGDVHRAAVITRRIAVHADSADDPGLLQLAYPRAFDDIVLAMAAEYDVPPALVFAVIRQESAFDADAVSPRRARGLMQMIRPTAVRMADSARLRRFHQRLLFEPEVSIRLGTLYLAQLLEQFDGNIVAAIASYHAGEDRVAGWLKTRGELELDELVEEIPYATTRGYVKKVLASYGVYRLLYDGADLPLGLARTSPGRTYISSSVIPLVSRTNFITKKIETNAQKAYRP